MTAENVNALSLPVFLAALPLLLKVTLLLLASGLAVLAFRRGAAAVRHLIWTLGIAAVLVLPVTSSLLPDLRLPVHGLVDVQQLAVPASTPTTLETVTEREEIRLIESSPNAAAVPAAQSLQPPLLEVTRTRMDQTLHELSPASWLLLLWESGVLLVSLYFLAGFLRLRRLEHRAVLPVMPELRAAAWRIGEQIGLARQPRILRSDTAITPMTWGIRRPVLLLPIDCDLWSAEQLRDVLLHELHHVRRNDALTQGMAQLVCMLLWFHPLVWMAERCMRREREHACDDQVLMAGSKASSYANHLLEMARSLRAEPRTAFASVAMARRSELSSRLLLVLDPQLRRDGIGRSGKLIVLMSALLMLVAIAAFEPSAGAADPDRPGRPVLAPTPRAAVGPQPARPARTPRPALAPVASAFGFGKNMFGWGEGERSRWSYNDDDEHLWMEVDGKVTFNADDTDIETMEPDSYFEIGEGRGRKAKRLEVESDEDGKITRTYFAGRESKEFDGEAKAWLAEILPRAVRNLGIDIPERAERIYKDGGVDGFLRELESIESSHMRGQYTHAFLELDGPTADERHRVLVEVAQAMDGDYERSQLLQAALANDKVSAAQKAELLAAAQALDSDYEAAQVLARVDAPELADGALRDAYFAMVDGIESDYERSQLLQSLLRQAEKDPQLAASILDAVEDVDSDYERSRVLGELIDMGSTDKEQQLRLVRLVEGIDSEYERTNLLIEMAEMEFADAQVRDAVAKAIDSIQSEHEYGRAMRALRRASGKG